MEEYLVFVKYYTEIMCTCFIIVLIIQFWNPLNYKSLESFILKIFYFTPTFTYLFGLLITPICHKMHLFHQQKKISLIPEYLTIRCPDFPFSKDNATVGIFVSWYQSVSCYKCGFSYPHRNKPCPAKHAVCSSCGLTGQFAKLCLKKQRTPPRKPLHLKEPQTSTRQRKEQQDKRKSQI